MTTFSAKVLHPDMDPFLFLDLDPAILALVTNKRYFTAGLRYAVNGGPNYYIGIKPHVYIPVYPRLVRA
jgi:hypothetical protein